MHLKMLLEFCSQSQQNGVFKLLVIHHMPRLFLIMDPPVGHPEVKLWILDNRGWQVWVDRNVMISNYRVARGQLGDHYIIYPKVSSVTDSDDQLIKIALAGRVYFSFVNPV